MTDPAVTHYRRAVAFLQDARKADSPEAKSRYLASAIEHAVAIVEPFLSQARDREQVRQLAWESLPRYRLLKRVRVHEFHRRPLPAFPSEWKGKKVRSMAMLGPVTLSTGADGPGSAGIIGNQFFTSGSGRIDRTGGAGSEKELWICNNALRDEFTDEWVDLETALKQYLAKAPNFIRAASRIL